MSCAGSSNVPRAEGVSRARRTFMISKQTRRRFLTSLSMAGAAGLLRPPRALAGDGAPETTTVRIQMPGLCVIPSLYIAEERLRAEGFTDIRYVEAPPA